MLSIQIDTKSLELVNNIKLSFFASHMKSSFPLCTFNHAVRLLDTIVYVVFILGMYFQRPLYLPFKLSESRGLICP